MGGIKSAGSGDNDDRRDVCDEHCQNVLETKRNCLRERDMTVKCVNVLNGGLCRFHRLCLLRTEDDLARLVVHAIHDCEGLEVVSKVADHATARLEALLDCDTDALNGCAGFSHDGEESLKRTAICKEVVDDQDVILRTQYLLGNDDLILALVGEGLYLSDIHLTVKIDALGFLCKYNRNMEVTCNQAGNADAGSLDCQDLSDRSVTKTFLELSTHLIDQLNIHLMIQEGIYLQYVTRFYNSVFYNAFFQKIHSLSLSYVY